MMGGRYYNVVEKEGSEAKESDVRCCDESEGDGTDTDKA